MKVDLDKFKQVLNSSSETIQEASEAVQSDPAKVMDFAPALMTKFEELQSLGSLEDIKASIESAGQTTGVRSAIQSFLQSTKEAQEKVGVMGAALFGSPQFKELTANLEQVKESLEKGKKVEGTEEGQGV